MTIAVDQPVLELETDKATLEVPSTSPGGQGNPGQGRRQGQARPGARRRSTKASEARRRPREGGEARQAAEDRRNRRSRAGIERRRNRKSREKASGACDRRRRSRSRGRGKAKMRGSARRSSTFVGGRRGRPRPAAATVRPCQHGVGAGRAVGAPRGARDRRGHQPGHGHRPERTHHRRRREGFARQILSGMGGGRSAAAGPARPRRARAAGLQQVGRGRTQADDRHPAQDGRAPQPRVDDDSRTSRSSTRPT